MEAAPAAIVLYSHPVPSTSQYVYMLITSLQVAAACSRLEEERIKLEREKVAFEKQSQRTWMMQERMFIWMLGNATKCFDTAQSAMEVFKKQKDMLEDRIHIPNVTARYWRCHGF